MARVPPDICRRARVRDRGRRGISTCARGENSESGKYRLGPSRISFASIYTVVAPSVVATHRYRMSIYHYLKNDDVARPVALWHDYCYARARTVSVAVVPGDHLSSPWWVTSGSTSATGSTGSQPASRRVRGICMLQLQRCYKWIIDGATTRTYATQGSCSTDSCGNMLRVIQSVYEDHR